MNISEEVRILELLQYALNFIDGERDSKETIMYNISDLIHDKKNYRSLYEES